MRKGLVSFLNVIESEGESADENAQLDLDSVAKKPAKKAGKAGGPGKAKAEPAPALPDAPPEEGVEKIKGHNYFIATVTRPPRVYRGNPFQVEVGLAYGGSWPADKTIELFRFANRVPLLFQRGACGITEAIVRTDWRNYQLSQPKGSLPVGPMALLVHIASVWVPFTSESKEAVAHYPDIIKEIQLAAQECGRKLATFIRKRKAADYQAQRRSIFELYIEEVAAAIGKITGKQARPDQEGVPAGRPPGHGGGDQGGGGGAGARGTPGPAEGEGPLRGGGGVGMRKDAVSKKTTAKIEKLAEGVLKAVASGKNPFLDIPVRSLANVSWSEKRRLVELGSQKQKRYFFNVSMAKKFMQTFLVSEACKELIDSGKTTSIRDLYYVTKHTIGDTRQNTFEEQDESDPIIEDLEVTVDALREELHLFAARKGSMVGPLTITDSGDTIDLRRMGSGGWAVPSIVEENVIAFRKHEAKYVLLDREGRGLDALQRGQVLEARELHHRPGRRPAPAGRETARAATAPRAQAAGLRAGRQRPVGLLHLQRHEAGLDQPRLRVDAHGGARCALHRPVVLRQGPVPAAGERRHQDGRRRQQPGEADARLPVVQEGPLAAGDPGDGAQRPQVRARGPVPAGDQLHHRGVRAEEAARTGIGWSRPGTARTLPRGGRPRVGSRGGGECPALVRARAGSRRRRARLECCRSATTLRRNGHGLPKIGQRPRDEGRRNRCVFGGSRRSDPNAATARVLHAAMDGRFEAVMTSARTYVGVALLGGVVGAIVGLMVAPGPGAETRRRIARHSIEDQERLLRLAEMGSDLLTEDLDLPASA